MALQTPASRRRIRSFHIRIPIISRYITFRAPSVINKLSIASILFSLSDCLLYLLGPLLILLALGILVGLTYSFFTIILPMLSPTGYLTPHAILHQTFVITILYNVLFNYYACVTAKNTHRGQNYRLVVRELADATGFTYPETPEELNNWKVEFRRHILARSDAIRELEREKLIRKHQLQHSHYHSVSNKSSDVGMKAKIMDKGRQKENTLEQGRIPDGKFGCDVNRNCVTSLEDRQVTVRNSDSPLDYDCENLSSSGTTIQKRRETTSTASTMPNVTDANNNVFKRSWMLLGPHDWSYCTKSRQPKPPRAHFDHVTSSLVLNMDHYCPWMFNVVGYFNYRYFCNFLIYVYVGMFYGTIVSYKPFLNMKGKMYHSQIRHYRKLFNSTMTNNTLFAGEDPPEFHLSEVQHIYPYVPTPSECTPVAFTFLLCCSVGIAVFFLLLFHLYLILTAQTTIEFHGNRNRINIAKAHGQVYINPYDLGYMRNLEQVYGHCSRRSNGSINVAALLWKVLAPSFREPEFLPVPLVGGLRACHSKSKEDGNIWTL